MKECKNCESPVSDRFARVLGSNDGRVEHCPECTSFSDCGRGAAADPDWEPGYNFGGCYGNQGGRV